MRIDQLVRNDLSPACFVWYRQYLEAMDTRDVEAFADFLSDDCVLTINNEEPVSGKSSIVLKLQPLWSDMPPMEHDLINIVGSDNQFALEALNHHQVDGATRTVRAAAFTERDTDGKARSVSLYYDPAPLQRAASPTRDLQS